MTAMLAGRIQSLKATLTIEPAGERSDERPP